MMEFVDVRQDTQSLIKHVNKFVEMESRLTLSATMEILVMETAVPLLVKSNKDISANYLLKGFLCVPRLRKVNKPKME
jgi:hypothetical protein